LNHFHQILDKTAAE